MIKIFLLHKDQCIPQNSVLCWFHAIMTIWNYLQYPQATVCWRIKKICITIPKCQKKKNKYHRSTNDGLHKYTCANIQLEWPPQHFSMIGCTLGQNMDQVCCFGFLILTVQTYTKWIQRLHNSTDMFSTDVRVIRMFAMSAHTRLLQRWNKAYVTRQVLRNKHVTTSFR
jgi:hypothetical protein